MRNIRRSQSNDDRKNRVHHADESALPVVTFGAGKNDFLLLDGRCHKSLQGRVREALDVEAHLKDPLAPSLMQITLKKSAYFFAKESQHSI
jgi:hypothetical protein